MTKGVVTSVAGSDVSIGPVKGFAGAYNLSDPGDSGAVWVEQATHAVVAIHIRGSDTGSEFALARVVGDALTALQLSWV